MKILSFLLHISIYMLIFTIFYHLIKSSVRVNFRKERILSIIYSGIFFLFMFLVISIIYTETKISGTEFNALKSIEDRREWIKEKMITRGKILDKHNKVIAGNTGTGLAGARFYTNHEAFIHLIGFSSETRKLRTGLEQTFNASLNGSAEGFNFIWNWKIFKNTFFNLVPEGIDKKLTIDSDLQPYIYRQFQRKPGAAIGLNPKTGEILFLVSSPGYTDKLLSENYDYLMKNNCFLNRAVKGRYEPGSTFKVIAAAAAIENNLENFTVNDTKEGFTPPGATRPIFNHDYEYFGFTNLEKAVKKSSNVYFSQLGIRLGSEKMKEYAERFFFNRDITLNSNKDIFKIEKSQFPDVDELSPNNLAWSSIGQYSLLITPFNMAVTAAIIANDGKYCQPYLEYGKKKREERIIKKKTSEKLRWMMFEVVGNPEDGLTGPKDWEDRKNFGTGYNARIRGVLVAGKTGTAENPHGAPHSWFIGFAPVDNPEIAFSIILEHGGTGSEGAAKLAGKILSKAKELGYFNEK